jgi:DNA-binding beta-propeller fold protein YncE
VPSTIRKTRCEVRLRAILAKAFLVLLLTATTAFPAERTAMKIVAVIAGDEFIGRFKSPGALFFDDVKKRLYIADTGNSRLVSLDSEYEYLAELAHGNLSLPIAVVKTKEGLFFTVDGEKGEIMSIDIKEELVEPVQLKGLPPDIDGFVPGRLAMDGEGRLYITDRVNGGILVADQDGSFLSEITVKEEDFFGFTDVRVGSDGNVYAVDTLGGKVYVFTSNGELVSMFGSREKKKGSFRFPTSLAVDKLGLIYVLDRHAGSILVFNRSGAFQYTIASPGPKEGQLDNPSYIFIDDEDRIYTIDGERIQVFQETQETE